MKQVYFAPNDDVIDPCWDNVFKAIFTKDTPSSKGALTGLLSAILGRKVEILQLTANEPAADNLRDRQIRYDITCKFGNGRLADIEMTVSADKSEPVRLEYYTARLFTSQNIRGRKRSYGDLKETYQISIIVNDRIYDDAEFLHIFKYYDEVHRVSLGGRSRIITVELSKIAGIAEKPAAEMTGPERWAFFFKYCIDKGKRGLINELFKEEESIAMAGETLLTISRDERERARLLSEYKYAVDLQSKMVSAERKGMQKGIQKGEQKAKQELAIKLLKRGLEAELIAEDTGLPADLVRSLKESL